MKAYEINMIFFLLNTVTYSVSTTLSWTEAHTQSITGKESLQKKNCRGAAFD